jgi:hypothetical protein
MVEAPNSPASPVTGEILDRPFADASGRPIAEDVSLEEQIDGAKPQEVESKNEACRDYGEEEASHDMNSTIGLSSLDMPLTCPWLTCSGPLMTGYASRNL